MACTIIQADLGQQFADIDPVIADEVIIAATEIVLGPEGACQTETEALWLGCCVDPCRGIVLVAQHMLSTIPGLAPETSKDVVSERVGDVAVTYSNATSTSGLWAGSVYGNLYTFMLGKYETCRDTRRTLPFAVGPSRGCGCA